jgi:hypothetical protein
MIMLIVLLKHVVIKSTLDLLFQPSTQLYQTLNGIHFVQTVCIQEFGNILVLYVVYMILPCHFRLIFRANDYGIDVKVYHSFLQSLIFFNQCSDSSFKFVNCLENIGNSKFLVYHLVTFLVCFSRLCQLLFLTLDTKVTEYFFNSKNVVTKHIRNTEVYFFFPFFLALVIVVIAILLIV